jgi:hypothetical protein
MSDDRKRIPTDPAVFGELNERKKALGMTWDGLFRHLLKMEYADGDAATGNANIPLADRLERQAERIEDAADRLERER